MDGMTRKNYAKAGAAVAAAGIFTFIFPGTVSTWAKEPEKIEIFSDAVYELEELGTPDPQWIDPQGRYYERRGKRRTMDGTGTGYGSILWPGKRKSDPGNQNDPERRYAHGTNRGDPGKKDASPGGRGAVAGSCGCSADLLSWHGRKRGIPGRNYNI